MQEQQKFIKEILQAPTNEAKKEIFKSIGVEVSDEGIAEFNNFFENLSKELSKLPSEQLEVIKNAKPEDIEKIMEMSNEELASVSGGGDLSQKRWEDMELGEKGMNVGITVGFLGTGAALAVVGIGSKIEKAIKKEGIFTKIGQILWKDKNGQTSTKKVVLSVFSPMIVGIAGGIVGAISGLIYEKATGYVAKEV